MLHPVVLLCVYGSIQEPPTGVINKYVISAGMSPPQTYGPTEVMGQGRTAQGLLRLHRDSTVFTGTQDKTTPFLKLLSSYHSVSISSFTFISLFIILPPGAIKCFKKHFILSSIHLST